MPNIFDYDGPAYVTAFSEIMERIEDIQNNELNATEQEKKLLNRFYKQLNSSRTSSLSRSRSRSRSNSRTKSRSANKSKSVKKNRNKMYRKKKTIKRKQIS